MISNVLQIKNLQKGFKDTQVVNLSSLSVQQGEYLWFSRYQMERRENNHMKMYFVFVFLVQRGEIEVFGQPIDTDKQYT